jgi:aerobic-type carbon monoxide dehydrogenase small subunit (CoxS/CutS family)
MKKSRQEQQPSKMEISVRINGAVRQLTIAPGDLLLDVLRREGCQGVKRGCETGECGVCTVLLDGVPVNSCVMFAAQVDGRELMTIEGVTPAAGLDPVQQSMVEHGAVQCGFCTPGAVLNS